MISRWPSWQARYSGVAPVLVWALSVLQVGHSARHLWPLLLPGLGQGAGRMQGHGGLWDTRNMGRCRGNSCGQAGQCQGWELATPWLPIGPRAAAVAAAAAGGH